MALVDPENKSIPLEAIKNIDFMNKLKSLNAHWWVRDKNSVELLFICCLTGDIYVEYDDVEFKLPDVSAFIIILFV